MKKMVGLILLICIFCDYQLNATQARESSSKFLTKGIFVYNDTNSFDVQIELQETYLNSTIGLKKVTSRDGKQFMPDLCEIIGFRINLSKNENFFASLGFGSFHINDQFKKNQIELFQKSKITTCRDISITIKEKQQENMLIIIIKNHTNGLELESKVKINEIKNRIITSRDTEHALLLS